MLKLGSTSLLFASLVSAEVHSLTLQQALELAARQNPEVALARLDEQRAEQGVQVALDPFRPKVYGGSGLAYTYGYPNSIDGNAPSLIELKTDMAIFNRPKSYRGGLCPRNRPRLAIRRPSQSRRRGLSSGRLVSHSFHHRSRRRNPRAATTQLAKGVRSYERRRE